MKPQTIQELEEAISRALNSLPQLAGLGALPPALQALSWLVPPGSRATVSLCRADNGRQIRSDASSNQWNALTGEALVTYQQQHEREERPRAPSTPYDGPARAPQVRPLPNEAELEKTLIRVLDKAERDPALNFVAFKFLRDRLLPQTGEPWTASPERCQSLITNAIAREMIFTDKVPNPRQPQFPVTSVKLNRENEAVKTLLEEIYGGSAPEFRKETPPEEAADDDEFEEDDGFEGEASDWDDDGAGDADDAEDAEDDAAADDEDDDEDAERSP